MVRCVCPTVMDAKPTRANLASGWAMVPSDPSCRHAGNGATERPVNWILDAGIAGFPLWASIQHTIERSSGSTCCTSVPGLGPRGTGRVLALACSTVMPSANTESVGIPNKLRYVLNGWLIGSAVNARRGLSPSASCRSPGAPVLKQSRTDRTNPPHERLFVHVLARNRLAVSYRGNCWRASE